MVKWSILCPIQPPMQLIVEQRPDSNPIVLEDIDPTSDWVVESHPTEFAFDEDMDFEL